MSRRVVLTGIGLMTPLGNTTAEFFTTALKGESRIRPVQKFDVSRYPVRIGGEVDIDPAEMLTLGDRPYEMTRMARLAVLAARRAVKDSDIDLEKEDPYAVNLVLGTASCEVETVQQLYMEVQKNGPGAALAHTPVATSPGAPAMQISIDLGLKGEVVNICNGCSSSASAIGYAMRLIRHGEADCVLTGGVDEGITPTLLSSFAAAHALSLRNSDPGHASRPFDRQRDGYVLSDASCMLMLEDYDRAKRRNARIYCEMAGFGATSDATSMFKVGRDVEAGAEALRKALDVAHRVPSDVNYYCAHGSSSRWTDIRETRMVKRVFREHAPKLAVSSIKSTMGHPLGASGAVQAATAALAISCGAVPPTMNYEEPDPSCDLDYVPNEAREMPVRNAMIYSLGQGGSNSALLLAAC